MTVFGWTVEQLAYAKRRHEQFGFSDMAPSTIGILELKKWWSINDWPAPLSVRLEGVKPEMNLGWAAEAIREALAA